MSAGGAFGGARGLAAKAPEKGVFPMDHFGECTKVKDEYMECLQRSGHNAEKCVDVAKLYLQCRMDNNLMAKQSLQELGLEGVYQPQTVQVTELADRSKSGFVAGIRGTDGVAEVRR